MSCFSQIKNRYGENISSITIFEFDLQKAINFNQIIKSKPSKRHKILFFCLTKNSD